MYKRIDGPREDIEGYSYENQCGAIERVSIPHAEGPTGVVDIMVEDRKVVEIYHGDIPKLIKALQAAYDYKE